MFEPPSPQSPLSLASPPSPPSKQIASSLPPTKAERIIPTVEALMRATSSAQIKKRQQDLRDVFASLPPAVAKEMHDVRLKPGSGDELAKYLVQRLDGPYPGLREILIAELVEPILHKFDRRMRDAVDKLLWVRFGRCEKPPREGERNFDETFWRIEMDTPGPQGVRLLLQQKIGTPAEAIDAMFDNLDGWQLDCSQFIQVVHLYARRHALGADSFNAQAPGGKLLLRVHGSTGVTREAMYMQDSPQGPVKEVSDNGKVLGVKDAKMEDLVSGGPVGSRVAWHNPDIDKYLFPNAVNENTIRLGTNLFAAHGVPWESNIPKNVYTRKELTAALAKISKSSTNRIFVKQLEYYVPPEKK
jgi:hypothetical protein